MLIEVVPRNGSGAISFDVQHTGKLAPNEYVRLIRRFQRMAATIADDGTWSGGLSRAPYSSVTLLWGGEELFHVRRDSDGSLVASEKTLPGGEMFLQESFSSDVIGNSEVAAAITDATKPRRHAMRSQVVPENSPSTNPTPSSTTGTPSEASSSSDSSTPKPKARRQPRDHVN